MTSCCSAARLSRPTSPTTTRSPMPPASPMAAWCSWRCWAPPGTACAAKPTVWWRHFPPSASIPTPGLATGYVVDTLQTVFHFFFRSRSFEECVVNTVNQGGDADTTGAIGGGLAGAYYGLEEIPRPLAEKAGQALSGRTRRYCRRTDTTLPSFGQQKQCSPMTSVRPAVHLHRNKSLLKTAHKTRTI